MKFREITKLPRRLLWAMVMEGVETTRMVKIFARRGRMRLRIIEAHRNPTPEELRQAVEQLKDIPRFLPFFVVVIVPLPGITEGYAIVALTLERWLGHRMRLLPSQLRAVFHETQEVESNDVTSEKTHPPDA